jgi:hypothetical protein
MGFGVRGEREREGFWIVEGISGMEYWMGYGEDEEMEEMRNSWEGFAGI